MSGDITKAVALRSADERDLDVSIDYARKLAASELLPESYRGKPQNVLVAIEHGRSIGIDPITAISMVHVIKGKPSASAQLIGALIRRAGHTVRLWGDAESATCEIIRADDPEFTFRSVWTYERARTAKVTGNPTWDTYRPQMLKARALSECGRDACPEVLAGISYLPEELDPQSAAPPVLPPTDDAGVVVADDVIDVESDALWTEE